jgi:hypothetical protein
MNKLITLTFLFLFLFSFVSASNLILDFSIVTGKQGECINLRYACPECSYMNITISSPNGTALVENEAMTNLSSYYSYNYSFCDTSDLGVYLAIMNYNETGSYFESDMNYFEITPSGNSGDENTFLFIIILVLGYTLNLLGFFKRNSYITILGGIILVFTGLYMINYGIIIFRSNLTLAISYITLFWGAGSSLWAAIEEIQDSM